MDNTTVDTAAAKYMRRGCKMHTPCRFGCARVADLQTSAVSDWAATSFTDSNLGKILDAFDAAALAKSSVFVLWSDHGWSLGDNDLWSSERC